MKKILLILLLTSLLGACDKKVDHSILQDNATAMVRNELNQESTGSTDSFVSTKQNTGIVDNKVKLEENTLKQSTPDNKTKKIVNSSISNSSKNTSDTIKSKNINKATNSKNKSVTTKNDKSTNTQKKKTTNSKNSKIVNTKNKKTTNSKNSKIVNIKNKKTTNSKNSKIVNTKNKKASTQKGKLLKNKNGHNLVKNVDAINNSFETNESSKNFQHLLKLSCVAQSIPFKEKRSDLIEKIKKKCDCAAQVAVKKIPKSEIQYLMNSGDTFSNPTFLESLNTCTE